MLSGNMVFFVDRQLHLQCRFKMKEGVKFADIFLKTNFK